MSLRAAERPGMRATTRHAQAIYPFMAAGGLGGRGVFIGRDSGGGAFCYDPWVLYGEGGLDDPNVIVLGKLGQGKSALVKTLLWRMLLFGRRAFVLDVKREYGPLCHSAGVRPISLQPGGGVRLNPLASRPEEHAQLELLRAVTVTALGVPLTQVEAAALREALRTVRTRSAGEPTLPDIATLMFAPVSAMAERLCTTTERLAADARRAALALQDLCEGPLRGLFDDHPGPRPRREAIGARSARGPRLAGGRDPDGLRDRVDERPAREDVGATRPGASHQRRGRVLEDHPARRPR